MSVKDRQLQRETARVLRKELLEGRYPDLGIVQQMVASAFVNRPAGLPRFTPILVTNKQISNAAHYNEMVDNLYEDLHTAFEEMEYHADRMMALASYYETEKNRINLQIKRLHRRMEILNEKLEERGLRTLVFDTFNDYLSLEFDGDSARNLPATNAFVDLRHGYAVLDRVKRGTSKIDLTGTEGLVEVRTEDVDFDELAPIDGALRDTINEAWRYVVRSEEPGEALISLVLELPEPKEMNMISFIPQTPRPVEITLFISEDGTNWREFLPRTVTSLTEWNFDTQRVVFVEFHLRKKEPDAYLDGEYHYFFGASNISMHRVNFVEKAYVVSRPHHIAKVVDKVTLKVDESILPHTDIQYFITEDKMDGSILEWQAIEPGESVHLNGLATVSTSINETAAEYANYYQSLYNHDYYTLVKLNEQPIPRTIKLFVGEAMYRHDAVDFPNFTGKPTLDTWKNITTFDTRYVPLEMTSAGFELSAEVGRLERLTLYLEMKEDYSLVNNPFTITGDVKVSVYLNNYLLKPVNGKYTYNFRKGINKVEVLYYSATGGSIAPNLSKNYLESIGATNIYANSESMTQVSLYDLLNNTSKTDVSKFAVDDDNRVILNYNPKAFDKANKGVRYKLEYKHPATSKQETYLRFMAVLKRDSDHTDLSPILRSYKLIIE